jgi:type 2 lantibiotic biosynthesis protein LanM
VLETKPHCVPCSLGVRLPCAKKVASGVFDPFFLSGAIPLPVTTANFSNSDLRDIAGRASTLDERRDGQVEIEESTDAGEMERRENLLSEWRGAAASGDELLFKKRLALEGMDEIGALHLLGCARLHPNQPLPDWARWFERAMFDAKETALPPTAPSGPAPFEELLWPIVVSARALLAERIAVDFEAVFSSVAILDLERSLVNRLSVLCGPGLYGDFCLFRHLARHHRGRFMLPFSQEGARIIYDEYVQAWHAGRRNDLMRERPVLARLIGVAVMQWVEATSEMIERLTHDLPRITGLVASGAVLGPVATVLTDLSDPHRGGKTVSILTFGSGHKVVYKPKDLNVDVAWSGLIDWLNSHGAPVALRPVKTLPMGAYGWAEFIANESVASGIPNIRDAALYYRRAGGVLALLHLLRATDFHHENVIVSDDFPIAVDLETLMSPRVQGQEGPEPSGSVELAQSLLIESVLSTLYLPTWVWGRGDDLSPIGGLDDPIDRSLTWTSFRGINTDAMAISSRDRDEAKTPPGGAARVAAQYDEFIGGFNELYAFIVRERDSLLASDGPLAAFSDVVVRVILMATRAYLLAQRRARAYASLSDGAAWSLHFDLLLRGYVAGDYSPELWASRALEREAAASCDVPLFTARGDSLWVEAHSGRRIDFYLSASPFEQLVARAKAFGEDSRKFQERMVASAIAPTRAGRYLRWTAGEQVPDLLALSIKLGETLDESAITDGKTAAWYGLSPIDHEHTQVSVLAVDLYAGTTGIAVFLAALARETGRTRFRELALAAIEPARALLTSDLRKHAARALGLGGGIGVGSIIYGLIRIAALLDEPRLLVDARMIAKLIDADLIASDRSYDVIRGGAGAILALVALNRATGDRTTLERATAVGRHLLEARKADSTGKSGWPTLERRGSHLTGISHGAAGIALALLRLYDATGEAAVRVGAIDALSYEREVFRPHLNDWPDFRFDPAPEDEARACQWCHGSAGIGLARLGCLDVVNDGEIVGEIEAALLNTLAAPVLPLDHLCCGNFGRLDFLLKAGIRLERPELIALARASTYALVERAVDRGDFFWESGDDLMNPSLFRGTAGIGYHLLRTRSPLSLPSVLLWDS